MRGADLNLKHLRVFLEVHRLEGITAAAHSVHMSQPAITQAIAGLERSFGTPLFTRTSSGLVPTEDGHILQRRCQRAFEQLNAAALRGKPVLGQRQVRLVTSRQLRTLIAIGRNKGYSSAARASGIAQPSLHRSAKELEALCDTRFFRVSENGVELSAAAKKLYQSAALAFVELDQAIEEIGARGGQQNAAVTVGSLPLSRGTILPRALNRLLERFPDTRVSIVDSPFEELLHALRFGVIDVMVGALRSPNPSPEIVQKELFCDRLGVFCGPDHPVLAAQQIDRDVLSAFPWVIARGSTPTRLHYHRYFEGLSPDSDGPTIETNSMASARHLLADNRKLAMLSVTQTQEYIEMGQLKRLPVDIGDTPRRIGISLRRDWQPTPVQKAFLHALSEEAQHMSEGRLDT